MICDVWPNSVRELVEYLGRNPWVRFSDLPGSPIQKFEGFRRGMICFSDNWRLPFRPTARREEVRVEFNVGGFRWMCGKAEIRVVYLGWGEAQ